MERVAVARELLQMLIRRRSWILLPLVLFIVLIGALVLLAEATPLGPLIYPLF